MADVETRVADHYTTGGLLQRFLAGLEKLGVARDAVTADDLKAGDEFHTGGLEATERILPHVDITPDMHVLDIGSGVGGPARLVASRFGCRATGVDLTPEFVDTATRLTELVGLDDKVRFVVGSATDLPLQDDRFDLAMLLHVGMNIEDKEKLFAEAARVLRPGGTFLVFEVMKGSDITPMRYPLPWAEVAETSFLAPPEAYVAAAEAAGFSVVHQESHRDFALDFFERAFAKIAAEGPPPLGLHMMMGETAGEKLQNYVENTKAGRVEPTEIVFRLAG